jgi:DnaJ-class molecular chaperone
MSETRLTTCPDCRGTGGNDDWSTCRKCKGSGLVPKTAEPEEDTPKVVIGPRERTGGFCG